MKRSLILLTALFLLAACGTTATLPPATTTPLPPSSTATSPPPTFTLTATNTLEPSATFTPAPTLLTTGEAPETTAPAKAIILFIGDGMGIGQRTAGRWLAAGINGKLAMDQMQVAGWSKTAAYKTPITDSAAGGTALATGVKTYNGYVGLDPDGNPVPTILEQAHQMGWAVGLVTTTQMAHATPAAFAAHTTSRENMLEIARQMMALPVDVLLGGGEDEFLPPGEKGCYPEIGERGDGRNLIDEAVAAGYTYLCDAAQLAALNPSNTTGLLGFFADEGMVRPFQPGLPEMTRAALEVLSQDPDGFFLMVEGGQIDWAAHDSNAENAMLSVLGLDAAIAVAQAYAATHPDTLIIVTADHETGGMTVSLEEPSGFRKQGPFTMPDGTEFYVKWEDTSHTPADVPVTAQGPWAFLLAGTYQNTFIYQVMYAALTGTPPPSP